MSKLNLSGVRVEGFDSKQNDEGKFVWTLKLSCGYTDKLAEQLEWLPEDVETFLPPANTKAWTFNNKLAATGIIITPNKEDLQKKHEMAIEIYQVGKFKYTHELDDNTQMPKNRRVEFEAKSLEEDLHIPIVAYMKVLNPGGLTATAKIEYADPEEPADDKQGSLIAVEERKRGRRGEKDPGVQ